MHPQILHQFETNKRRHLRLAIVLDIIGMLSYALPLWGESADFVWAPLAAIAQFALLGGRTAWPASLLTLAEEGFPATDIVPSFLLFWWVKYVLRRQSTLQKLAAQHPE